jgi:hypothetical protein
MKTAQLSGLAAAFLSLVIQPLCALGASVPNFPPNPVGEKLYRTQLYHETLLPLAIVAITILVAGVVHRISRRSRRSQSPA